jgi:DNA-binding NtrC family response regulator
MGTPHASTRPPKIWPRILLFEKDSRTAEQICRVLALGGIRCQVQRVETRTQFFEALEQGGLDIAVVNYQLPNFDAVFAMENVQVRCPFVPIILLSSVKGEEMAIETLRLGAMDYVMLDRLPRLIPVVYRALQRIESRKRFAEKVSQKPPEPPRVGRAKAALPKRGHGVRIKRQAEHLLLVDADEAQLCFLKSYLVGLGYRVAAFTDSHEAFRYLEVAVHSVDLILTNVTLPTMKELYFIKHVPKLNPKTRMIFSGDSDVREELVKQHLLTETNFILKPYQLSEIAKQVSSILKEQHVVGKVLGPVSI